MAGSLAWFLPDDYLNMFGDAMRDLLDPSETGCGAA